MTGPTCQAVVDMVMDQRPLRLGNGPLDGMELRGKIDAGSTFLDHADDPAQMSLGALQPGGDGRMACVCVIFWHISSLSPPGGWGKRANGANPKGR